MIKKNTIKDIAALAGVSKGTVDRVIHNRGKISQKALDKVNTVLDEIKYVPNLIARNLKLNKAYHICVVFPNPSADPYWTNCINGMKQAINEFKAFSLFIEPLYFNPKSKKSFLKTNETALNSTPDAVLLAPLFYKETLEVVSKYQAEGITVSAFNNQVESPAISNFVGQNLFKSGRVAANLIEHITNEGQIAIIHVDESYKNAIHMQEKERGFRDYFSRSKLNYEVVTLNLKNSNFEIKLNDFLDKNPRLVGVFITTSKAYQVTKIISGRTEPNPIKIIGYDLIEQNRTYLTQGLIHFLIHQNPKTQVYLGTKQLIEHFLFDKEIPNVTHLPIEIINSENIEFYDS